MIVCEAESEDTLEKNLANNLADSSKLLTDINIIIRHIFRRFIRFKIFNVIPKWFDIS